MNRRSNNSGNSSSALSGPGRDGQGRTGRAGRPVQYGPGLRNVAQCVEIQRSWPDTCDKVLDDMLPPGYTSTV